MFWLPLNSVSNEACGSLNRQLFFFYMCYLNPILNTNRKRSGVWSIQKLGIRSFSFETDAINQLAEKITPKGLNLTSFKGSKQAHCLLLGMFAWCNVSFRSPCLHRELQGAALVSRMSLLHRALNSKRLVKCGGFKII